MPAFCMRPACLVYCFYFFTHSDAQLGRAKEFSFTFVVFFFFFFEYTQNYLGYRIILQSWCEPIEPLRWTPPLGNVLGVRWYNVVYKR